MTPESIADRYIACLQRGRTLFFAGNGGSHAQAQHTAAEFVVRYRRTGRGLPAIALGCNPAVVSATVNDLGELAYFAREFEALAHPDDCLTLFSTSGLSPNILHLQHVANQMGVETIALFGGEGTTADIQASHFALMHQVCELVEGRCR